MQHAATTLGFSEALFGPVTDEGALIAKAGTGASYGKHSGEECSEFAALIQRLRDIDYDTNSVRKLTILRDCIRDGPEGITWAEHTRNDPTTVLFVGQEASAGLRQPVCAERPHVVHCPRSSAPATRSLNRMTTVHGTCHHDCPDSCGWTVTVEDGVRDGGIGMSMFAQIDEFSPGAAVTVLGTPTRFIPHGDPKHILARFGLDADGIEQAARDLLA